MYVSMICRPFNSSSRKAFTLLEVLAAVFVFGIMTTAIVATIKGMTRMNRRAKSHEVTTASIEVAAARLQNELQMAFNEKIQRQTSSFKAQDAATGYELTFTFIDSEMMTLFERRTPGFKVAQYKLEKDDKTYRLLRTEVPLIMADKLKDAPTQVIAEGLLDWKMEFYDPQNDIWVKDWDSAGNDHRDKFPQAARLVLESVDTSLPPDQWKDKSLRIQTSFFILNEKEDR